MKRSRERARILSPWRAALASTVVVVVRIYEEFTFTQKHDALRSLQFLIIYVVVVSLTRKSYSNWLLKLVESNRIEALNF